MSSGFAEFWAGLQGRSALLNRDKVNEMLAKYWLCSPSLAREELGFQIRYPLRRGVELTAKWYLKNKWL